MRDKVGLLDISICCKSNNKRKDKFELAFSGIDPNCHSPDWKKVKR
jgi:hypothetical protein